jgi:hypothetical protein
MHRSFLLSPRFARGNVMRQGLCTCIFYSVIFYSVISQYSRTINKTRGWDIPIKLNSWNKVPCGQFIKEISVWYLNVNKRYGRLKNRSRHQKSTQGKQFLIILNSRIQPQRKVVLRWFFFQIHYKSMYLRKKKSSSRSWVAIQRNIYMRAYGISKNF